MNNVIYAAVYFGVTLAAFLLGKYVFPKVTPNFTGLWKDLEKMDVICKWADKFVVWAREFLQTKTGKEKMVAVIEQLKQVTESAGIEVTEEQLKAIAQTAYESMKAGKEAQTGQFLEAKALPLAAPGMVINTGAVAVATDKVPDGALQNNPNGTVNVYDAAGNKVGTVSAEAAEKIASNMEVITTEDNG